MRLIGFTVEIQELENVFGIGLTLSEGVLYIALGSYIVMVYK